MATEARRSAAGEDVLAALYGSHRRIARRAIARRVQSSDVDDVLQRTAVRLWRAVERGRVDVSRLPALIWTIADRTAIEHYNSERRRPAVVPSAALGDVDHDSSSDAPVTELLAAEALWEAWNALIPRDQRLLKRWVSGDDRAQVASDEGMSHAAVAMASCRARQRLKAGYWSRLAEKVPVGFGVVSALRLRLRRAVAERDMVDALARAWGAVAVAAVTASVVVSCSRVPHPDAVVARGAGAVAEAEWLGRRDDGVAAHVGSMRLAKDPVGQPHEDGVGKTPRKGPIEPRPLFEIDAPEARIARSPDAISTSVRVEWSDLYGSGYLSVEGEMQCWAGVTSATACGAVRAIPGTSDRIEATVGAG